MCKKILTNWGLVSTEFASWQKLHANKEKQSDKRTWDKMKTSNTSGYERKIR